MLFASSTITTLCKDDGKLYIKLNFHDIIARHTHELQKYYKEANMSYNQSKKVDENERSDRIFKNSRDL